MVLILSFDESMQILLESNLVNEGFQVEIVSHADKMFELLSSGYREYSLLIVDMIPPRIDGLSICKRLRSHGIQIPVFLLTFTEDKFYGIVALELGADDYIVKPFNRRALVARAKAILRRYATTNGHTMKFRTEIPRVDDIYLDVRSCELVVRNLRVSLTIRETAVLEHLLQNRNLVVSRDDLVDAVWGSTAELNTRIVDKIVSLLRRKLNVIKNSPFVLRTVRGVGYLLSMNEVES